MRNVDRNFLWQDFYAPILLDRLCDCSFGRGKSGSFCLKGPIPLRKVRRLFGQNMSLCVATNGLEDHGALEADLG